MVMENTPMEQSKFVFWNRRNSWIVLGIVILLFSVLLCYAILSIISSRRFIEVYNTKLSEVEISHPVHYNDSIQPSFVELISKKVFLESQLSLLNSDSLNLVIDLKDSMLSLVIEGVAIHSTSIKKFYISRFYKALTNDAYVQVFSEPFAIEGFNATIAKEPITVKQAPKDTLEAATFFEMPDTIIFDFVAVTMYLNRGFLLTMFQEEKATGTKNFNDRFFLSEMRLRKALNDLYRMMHFRLPGCEPEIRIYLPKDELVTLYRALPVSAQVAVRLR
jgi:hypothetical protein